jgi:excisionase family DNA binding protein
MSRAALVAPSELLSPDEVVARLRVGRHQVYALIRRGELPAVRVGKLLRIPAAVVLEFVASGGSRRQ